MCNRWGEKGLNERGMGIITFKYNQTIFTRALKLKIFFCGIAVEDKQAKCI